jgi:sigma-B regulation protein RsbU (phosphoserine phosphatase)
MNAKGMFVTIIYGILNRITREFIYVRAGHDDPLVLDALGRVLEIKSGMGKVIGLHPFPRLDTATLTIPVGGTMILYTDGVTEARNSQGGFFELEGLLATIPRLQNQPAMELCNALITTLDAFHGEAPQADDITVIAVQAK